MTTNITTRLIFFLRFFLILLLTSHAQAKTLTLSLNWKPEPEFGGFYAADLEGYFKKEGLDLTVQAGGSGTPTIQMLATDKIDFAVVGGDEIVVSRDHGTDAVALFAVYQTGPYMVMAHAERNFKTIADVFMSEGNLALQTGLPFGGFLKAKFPKPKVKIVPYPGGITNFLHDKNYSQQGFITSEPIAAEKIGAKVKTFLIADEGYNPYTTVLAVRKKTIDENPAMVKKVVSAVKKGWEAYLKNPSKTNERMQKINPSMDAETFKKSADIQVDLIQNADTKKSGLGSMSQERWSKLAKQLKELGLIKNPAVADKMFVNY